MKVTSVVVMAILAVIPIFIACLFEDPPYLIEYHTALNPNESSYRAQGTIAFPRQGVVRIFGYQGKLLELVVPFDVQIPKASDGISPDEILREAARGASFSKGRWHFSVTNAGAGWMICFLTFGLFWLAIRKRRPNASRPETQRPP